MQSKRHSTALFISTTAWVSIIIFAVVLYYCLVNFFSYYLEIELGLEQAFKGWTADRLDSAYILSNAISLFVLYAAAFLVAAVGILERRDWARKLYVGLSGFLILMVLGGIVSFLVYGYRQEVVHGLGDLDFREKFLFVATAIPSVLIGWTLFRTSFKLAGLDSRRFFQ